MDGTFEFEVAKFVRLLCSIFIGLLFYLGLTKLQSSTVSLLASSNEKWESGFEFVNFLYRPSSDQSGLQKGQIFCYFCVYTSSDIAWYIR